MQQTDQCIFVTPFAWIGLAFSVVLLPLDWVAAWLLAIFVHEAGHITACLLCGARIHQIRISVTGAKITSESLSYGKQVICSLAGPVSGMLLFIFSQWLSKAAACALVQTIFNLLPLTGFDGGNSLRALLFMCMDDKKAERTFSWVNKSVKLILFFVVIYMAFRFSLWVVTLIYGLFLFRNRCNKNSLQTEATEGTICMTNTNEVRL